MNRANILKVIFMCLILINMPLIVSAQSRGIEIEGGIDLPTKCKFTRGINLEEGIKCNNAVISNIIHNEKGIPISLDISANENGGKCQLDGFEVVIPQNNQLIYRSGIFIGGSNEEVVVCLQEFNILQNKEKLDLLLISVIKAIQDNDKKAGDLAKSLYEELGGKEKFLFNLEQVFDYYGPFVREKINEGKLPRHMLRYLEDYKEDLLKLANNPQYIGLTIEEFRELREKELDAKDLIIRKEFDEFEEDVGFFSEEYLARREKIYSEDLLLQDMVKQKDKAQAVLDEIAKLTDEQKELIGSVRGEKFSQTIYLSSLIAQRKNKLTGEISPDKHIEEMIKLQQDLFELQDQQSFIVKLLPIPFIRTASQKDLFKQMNEKSEELEFVKRKWQDDLFAPGNMVHSFYNPITNSYEGAGSYEALTTGVLPVGDRDLFVDILLIYSAAKFSRTMGLVGEEIGLLKITEQGGRATIPRFVQSTGIEAFNFHTAHNLLRAGTGELTLEDWSPAAYADTFAMFAVLGGVGRVGLPKPLTLPAEIAGLDAVGVTNAYFAGTLDNTEDLEHFLLEESLYNTAFIGGLRLANRAGIERNIGEKYQRTVENDKKFRDELVKIRSSDKFRDLEISNVELMAQNPLLIELGKESLKSRSELNAELRKVGKISEEIFNLHTFEIAAESSQVSEAESISKTYKSLSRTSAEKFFEPLNLKERAEIQIELMKDSGMDPIKWIELYAATFATIAEDPIARDVIRSKGKEAVVPEIKAQIFEESSVFLSSKSAMRTFSNKKMIDRIDNAIDGENPGREMREILVDNLVKIERRPSVEQQAFIDKFFWSPLGDVLKTYYEPKKATAIADTIIEMENSLESVKIALESYSERTGTKKAERVAHDMRNVITVYQSSLKLLSERIKSGEPIEKPVEIPVDETLEPIRLKEIEVIVNQETGETARDVLYQNVVKRNIELIYKDKSGVENEHLGKFLVYVDRSGKLNFVAWTKDLKVHHADVYGELIGGEKGKQIAALEKDYPLDVLQTVLGYQSQYDKKTGKITGIQLTSSFTDDLILQNAKRKKKGLPPMEISKDFIEKSNTLIIESIDPGLLGENVDVWVNERHLRPYVSDKIKIDSRKSLVEPSREAGFFRPSLMIEPFVMGWNWIKEIFS